jgi:uncharacterized membrane protein
MRVVTSLLLLIAMISLASAVSEVVIHIDETGRASFYGTSDTPIVLPDGVSLNNGRISGSTALLTSKSGNVWSFSISLPDSEIELFLPKDAVIISTNGEISATIRNIVVYSQDDLRVDYTLNTNSSALVAIIIILILAVLAATSFYLFVARKKITQLVRQIESASKRKFVSNKESRVDIIAGVLNDKERTIISILKDKKRINSSYLRKLSGMPKSSFFRNLTDLEKRGIIKRSGDGKNKIVELK